MLWLILVAFIAGILGYRRGLRKGYEVGRAAEFYAWTVRERLSSRLAEPCVRRAPYLPDQNRSPLAQGHAPQTARHEPQGHHSGVIRALTRPEAVPQPAMGRIVLLGLLAAVLGIVLGFSLRHTARTTAAPRPAVESPQTDTADTPDDLGSIIHKAYGK